MHASPSRRSIIVGDNDLTMAVHHSVVEGVHVSPRRAVFDPSVGPNRCVGACLSPLALTARPQPSVASAHQRRANQVDVHAPVVRVAVSGAGQRDV